VSEAAPAPFHLLCGANWRRVQAHVQRLGLTALPAGPTLWEGRHLIRTDGSSVDFSRHVPGTVFYCPGSLAPSSAIRRQFERRGWPVHAYDYPPKAGQRSWLAAQMTKRGLDSALAGQLLTQCSGDYARLHMELDRLALAPASEWQLSAEGREGQTLIEAWARGDVAGMHHALACLTPQQLHAALTRLLGIAHALHARHRGARSSSGWLDTQARALRVPTGWVDGTLRLMGQLPAVHVEVADAICRLDLARRTSSAKARTAS
jgi:hypothetical protein